MIGSNSGPSSVGIATHYERAPRFRASKLDVAATAAESILTGWSEPVCGRESHPLSPAPSPCTITSTRWRFPARGCLGKSSGRVSLPELLQVLDRLLHASTNEELPIKADCCVHIDPFALPHEGYVRWIAGQIEQQAAPINLLETVGLALACGVACSSVSHFLGGRVRAVLHGTF
jgi:hypothetical protein